MTQPPPLQPTAFQPKSGAWPTYRPIAPSLAPVNVLPQPNALENSDKRKWSSSLDDIGSNKTNQRRGSNSSQGSNSSTILAADQRKRRKEQNRAAQRAFRERKERYVKELEDKIKGIEAAYAVQVAQLESENNVLKTSMKEMEIEMKRLQGGGSVLSAEKMQSSIGTPSLKGEESPPLLANGSMYSNSPALTTVSANTPPQILARVSSSAVACIRDKDGVSFCQRLKEEVCSNAYDQLLTEPLFDAHGFLNETVASHPVPIVTSTKDQRSKTEIFNELEQLLNSNSSSPTLHDAGDSDFISCSTVWSRMTQHPLFDKFDTNDLVDALKKRAKCSRQGPVFEEYEVQEVLDLMIKRVNQADY